jgi:hypothetical protein
MERTFSVEDLSPGTYVIRISYGGRVVTKSFVKQ